MSQPPVLTVMSECGTDTDYSATLNHRLQISLSEPAPQRQDEAALDSKWPKTAHFFT